LEIDEDPPTPHVGLGGDSTHGAVRNGGAGSSAVSNQATGWATSSEKQAGHLHARRIGYD